MNKIIGTFAPLFCLKSSAKELTGEEHGTTATAQVFLKWLKDSKQGAWQLLPLSETHLEPSPSTTHVPSPYKGYGIGLDPKWLSEEERAITPTENELALFLKEEDSWIDDYTLFVALRDYFKTDNWTSWEKSIRLRHPAEMKKWRVVLRNEIHTHAILQWQCGKAFNRLRETARASEILIIGDLPFYTPLQSPLVWAHTSAFQLEQNGTMEKVSGLPDGPKAHYGRQVWGHPLYNWQNTSQVLQLWKLRMKYFSCFYDMMRLDHAKGFFHFGAMHLSDSSQDKILDGPGANALESIISYGEEIGLSLYAEDAGDRLEGVRKTLNDHDIPGIRILRFAYNEHRKSIETDYADVANYPENSLTVTSTHDTIPLRAYAEALDANERIHVARHIGIEPTDDLNLFTTRLIAAGIHSPSYISLVQMQDWLMSKARINVPGTETPTNDPNWRYRMEKPIETLPKQIFS